MFTIYGYNVLTPLLNEVLKRHPSIPTVTFKNVPVSFASTPLGVSSVAAIAIRNVRICIWL